MWKAFDEMEELGWIGSQRPRMVVVQSEGCAPIVKAFCGEQVFAEPWPGAATVADGLRVPAVLGDFLILRALGGCGGTATEVPDGEMVEAARFMGRIEGIFACPEGAATLVVLQRRLEQGWIEEGERVVLFNTGSGLKYAHLWA
jgi:threonine synthase